MAKDQERTWAPTTAGCFVLYGVPGAKREHLIVPENHDPFYSLFDRLRRPRVQNDGRQTPSFPTEARGTWEVQAAAAEDPAGSVLLILSHDGREYWRGTVNGNAEVKKPAPNPLAGLLGVV